MAIRLPVPLLAAFVAAGLAVGAADAAAQSDVLHFEILTLEKTITPGDVAQFPVEITNQSQNDVDLIVRRTENALPDTTDWFSALCFGVVCYSKDMSSPPPATIKPGEKFHFELSVQGGYQVNSTGRIKVTFGAGLFGGTTEKEFIVRVNESASSVGTGSTAALSAAYPNPARSTVSIPLPAVSSVRNLKLELCDATGARVADLTDRAGTAIAGGADKVDLDVSSHPSGHYFYRLMFNDRSITGPIVIAR